MNKDQIENFADEFDDGARDGWKFSESALLAFARALLAESDKQEAPDQEYSSMYDEPDETVDRTDTVSRAARILRLVDEYEHWRTKEPRDTLRHALYEELRATAPAQSAASDKQEAVAIVERKAYWSVRPLIDWEKIGDGTKLYAHPIASADVRDAERYRWLRDRTRGWRIPAHGGTGTSRQVDGFQFPLPQPVGNVMQGSVAQHLDDAIDAAIAANRASEGGGKS